MNQFTDSSRDARLTIGVPGFMDMLRAPEALRSLVMTTKPATTSLGDFTLKALLDSMIDGHKVRGDYRAIQSLLVSLFGPLADESATDLTIVRSADKRQARAR